MGLITKTYTFSAGATILAAEHNTNYDTLFNWANGNVDNANVKANAGIALSKISLSDDATFTGDISFTSAATTDDSVTVTGSSLTTGSALKIYSNSSSTSTRNLVEIINDHADADATTPLQIQQDGDAAHINLTGDPANSSPVDGDVWYDGTNFKGYNGTTTFLFNSVFIKAVTASSATATNVTTNVPNDNTVPTTSEATVITALDLAITPSSASNTLIIEGVVNMGTANADAIAAVCIFVDSGANAVATFASSAQNGRMLSIPIYYSVSAASTSARTYKIGIGASSGNSTLNGDGSGNRLFGGVAISRVSVREVVI